MNDISNHENQFQTAIDDQKKEFKLALEIARLKLDINGYKTDLENAATDEERRWKEKQIETKELLLLRLSPQQMQVAQPGNKIF